MRIQIGRRWVRLEDATPLERLYDELRSQLPVAESALRSSRYEIQKLKAQCAALLKLIK